METPFTKAIKAVEKIKAKDGKNKKKPQSAFARAKALA